MTIFTDKEGKKAFFRSLTVKFLIFTGLIALSVAVMRPVQIALHTGISHIRTNIITRIETLTGMEVRFSSIRPTFFGTFDIRNLRLINDDNVFLSVNRARIYFSVADLLMGRGMSINSVLIDKPSVHLDLEHLPSIAETENELQLTDFFPGQVEIKIRDGFLKLADSARQYQIQNISFDIILDSHEISATGRLNPQIVNLNLLNRKINIKTEVVINGVYNSSQREGRAEINFNTVTASGQAAGTLFEINPISIILDYKNRILSFHTSKDQYNNMSLNFNQETGGISAAVNSMEFQPSSFIRFFNNDNLNNFFAQPLSGAAVFEAENNLMQYTVNFNSSSLGINFYGNEKHAEIRQFKINDLENSPSGLFFGSFNFFGNIGFAPFTPTGRFVFDNFGFSGENDVNAVFAISNNSNEITISGESFSIGYNVFERFDIYVFPSAGDLSVTLVSVCTNGGHVDIDAILNYSPMQLELILSLDSVAASFPIGIIDPFTRTDIPVIVKNYLQHTYITTEIFVTTDFIQFVYNAPRININSPNNLTLLSLAGTERQLMLTEGIFYGSEGNSNIYFSAFAGFANPMDMTITLLASYLDYSWELEGSLLDRNTLFLSDPNGLNVYGSLANTGAISGYIEGNNYPIVINNTLIYLDFYVVLRYSSFDSWDLDVSRFMASSHGRNAEQFSLSGLFNQDGGSFTTLQYSDSRGGLAGNADFLWHRDFSFIQFDVNLNGENDTGEKFFAQGIVQDRSFDIQAEAVQLRIDRFLSESDLLLVDADISFSFDSLHEFNAQLNLSSVQGRYRYNAIQGSGSLLFCNDEFVIQNLGFEFEALNILFPVFQFSRKGNFARANAYLSGNIRGIDLETSIETYVDFGSIDSWLEITHVLNNFNGRINAGTTRIAGEVHEPSDIVFSRNEGSIFLSGGPQNMVRLNMDANGNFFAGLSAPLPIRGSVIGNLSNRYINAHCNNLFVDLPAIWNLLPGMAGFRFNGGYVTARLDIRGPIDNPEFFGTGRGTSFRMNVPGFIPDDIRLVPFNFIMEGHELVFNRVSTAVGGGGGSADGWLRFENWVPRNVGLDITIPRENPVPFDFHIVPFMANGDASGRLFINLENELLEINGNLLANNTEMGVSDATRAAPSNYALDDARVSVSVNLTITTGPSAEFSWPNPIFPVIRANLRMGTVLNVTADSQAEQFTLNSDVDIRSGELFYFDRVFHIRSGNLVLRENEQEFNPRLSAVAEIRERTDTGPVTISMIIQDEPLLNFSPRFQATPSLTQVEIFSLLGQNLYGVGGGEDGNEAERFLVASGIDLFAQYLAGSDAFGQLFRGRQFERRVRNLLNLDMFSVRTRFLQNAFTEVLIDTPAMGLTPVDRNNRVGNYFNNSSVFLGKYVGQDMFIQGMITMRYDHNNPDFGGLIFEPDIGIELQSPFFNIRWDLGFDVHSYNLWGIRDNSITLLWSRTF